jgi:nucleoid DNA-binding protein
VSGVLDALLSTIQEALTKYDDVRLTGVCTLYTVNYKGHVRRHPQSGQMVHGEPFRALRVKTSPKFSGELTRTMRND